MLGARRDCLAGEQNIGPACGRSEVIGLHGWYAGSAWGFPRDKEGTGARA